MQLVSFLYETDIAQRKSNFWYKLATVSLQEWPERA